MALFFKCLAGTLLAASSMMILSSCGSGTDTADDSTITVDDVKNSDEGKSAKNVFYSIPSPVELANLVKKAGAVYDYKILNDPENHSKYSTSISQALNLGVYGTDLSMTTIFDRTQESMFYLKSARRLADKLGITGAFSDETVNRMDANRGHHDSLLGIITDSYFNTDEYLKENQRPNVSALIMAGGWIEGLYIGTQLAKTTKNNAEIIQRIADLKGSLENLMSLLEIYKGEEGIDAILADLATIRKVYDNMAVQKNTTNVNTDDKTKVTTIGGGDIYTFSKEQLEEVTKVAAELRTRIVS